MLLKNQSKRNSWLTVRLVGTTSNRDAVGAVVRVHLPERILSKEVRAGSSFLSSNSPWLTFGLNKDKKIDKVEVSWPSGQHEVFAEVKGRRMITIIEGQGLTYNK